MKDRFDIHQEITNRIVSAIEAGAGEFKLPWHRAASTRAPINETTGRAYRGVNILSLWITSQALGCESHKWATFKQWQERGANVRKGEKGTPIVFYKNLPVDAREESGVDGEEGGKTIPFARASWVFNASQVDGYPTGGRATGRARLDQAHEVSHGARRSRQGSRCFYARSGGLLN